VAEAARREERVLRYRDERVRKVQRMQVDVDSVSARVNWSHLSCASQKGHLKTMHCGLRRG
jgi:hypothetical protein